MASIMLVSSTLFLVHVTVYWTACLFFSIISEYLHTSNNKVYHIVAEKRAQNAPPWGKIKLAIIVSAINQLISYPVIYGLINNCVDSELNYSVKDYGLQFMVFTAIADQWFYWTHRAMHRVKFLYNNIHYIHHQWTYPIAVRTIYAHPVEHIITNVGTLIVPPLIWSSSLEFLMFWVGVATFNAVAGHSGIHFPVFTNEKHDLHHRYLNCNYGTFGLSDRMFGTRRFST